MKRTSKELKSLSRDVLLGKFGIPMIVMLISTLIPSLAIMPFDNFIDSPSFGNIIMFLLATLIIELIGILLSAGTAKVHLSLVRGEPYSVGMLFSQFKNHPDRFIGASLLFFLIVIVSMIPAFLITGLVSFLGGNNHIPAIVLGSVLASLFLVYVIIRFSLYPLLLVEHSEMGAIESLKESARLTHGNVGRILYIELSFIPFSILGGLSFGIGLLWIQPYMIQTTVNLYLDITGDLDAVLEKRAHPAGEGFDYYA
ncbi:MAG: DUF975 family protein [Lachnospiraceae bacterium]